MFGGLDMAVYTSLSDSDMQALLARFNLGDLRNFTGAADGIENTTYFVTCQRAQDAERHYVLSIIETGDYAQIRFCSALTTRLHEAGLPVPCPLPDRQGESLQTLQGKPALLFDRAPGQHLVTVNASHCRAIGDYLARSHQAALHLGIDHPNQRGVLWMNQATQALADKLAPGEAALLQDQNQRYRQMSAVSPNLPRGPIHGDLFRDNALFHNDRLTAVIDFYNACCDWLLLDVAVAVNDWCCDSEGEIVREQAEALLVSYHAVRPFTLCEHQYWQDLLCLAATRFWVSRLLVRYCPELVGGVFRRKDPSEFLDKLERRMVSVPPLPGKPAR